VDTLIRYAAEILDCALTRHAEAVVEQDDRRHHLDRVAARACHSFGGEGVGIHPATHHCIAKFGLGNHNLEKLGALWDAKLVKSGRDRLW